MKRVRGTDPAELLKVVLGHERTVDVCQACAETTRDLAAEVKRGGVPSREHLASTITEAENVLQDLRAVRAELDRLKRVLGAS